VRRTDCRHPSAVPCPARVEWLCFFFSSIPMSTKPDKKTEDTRSSGLRPSHRYGYSLAGSPDANHSLPSGLWTRPGLCPLAVFVRRTPGCRPASGRGLYRRPRTLTGSTCPWQVRGLDRTAALPHRRSGLGVKHASPCPESVTVGIDPTSGTVQGRIPCTIHAQPTQRAGPYTDRVRSDQQHYTPGDRGCQQLEGAIGSDEGLWYNERDKGVVQKQRRRSVRKA
jgi:hypothetical protein